jgi:hypothetical protein
MPFSRGVGARSFSPVRRCPACGHRLKGAKPTACPLCGFCFDDERVTGADVSPYAKAYTHGALGWRLMSEWVWLAGAGRLKHLALMRASVASRRFARINVALLVIGLAIFWVAQVGWHEVGIDSALEPIGSVQPEGQGWLHVAAAPRPLPAEHDATQKVDLWWSVPQAALAVVLSIPVGVLGAWLVLIFIRVVVTWAHKNPYRLEGRMTAALHYSTAWAVPVAVAAAVTGFFPLCRAASIARWSWVPPQAGFTLASAVVAGFAVCMWWFWLVRLGWTAPLSTRGRVVVSVGLTAPLIVAAGAAGWYFGLDLLHETLTEALRLMF